MTPAAAARLPALLRRDAGRVLAVFLAFTIGAVLSWESFGSTAGPSFFYPSAGVTAAALMLSRRALWPAIAAAVVAAELLVDSLYGNPLVLSVAFAASNVVEPLVGALLVLAWCSGPPDLRKRRDFVAFIVGACVAGPFVGGLIGGTVRSVVNGRPWLSTALTWWSGDALGVLVVASPILLWSYQSSSLRRRPWDVVAVLVVTVLLSVATFWAHFAQSILILPALAWAAFRVGMLGAAIAGAVAAFLVNIMSTRGEGPFSHQGLSPYQQVVLTQIYLAVIIVVAMLIAQEAAGRASAVAERETERRERLRLESLSRLAQQLSAALTPLDIGEALINQVLNEAGASALSLGLISGDGRKLDWVASSGYPAAMLEEVRGGVDLREQTLANEAIRSAVPVAVGDASTFAAAYPERAHWLRLAGAEAVVSWPLAAGGRPFGVVQMAWATPQTLNNAQLAYVSAVSTMVSQTLVRAKMYTDEHARAAVLHEVAQPVDQVDAVGVQYSALYRPADAAHGLGGDWYSVMALPDSRTFLTVGDVIGHGLPSVQDMARLRSTSDAYAHQGLAPAQILGELNRFAAHQIRGEFATALVAIFDPKRNSLTYSSAGHLPALLRRANTGDVVRLSNASGPMIGPFADSVYIQDAVSVQPGDVLMMYTDGLVEHYDEGLMAGIAHLEQVLAAWPPEALLDCEALAADVAPIVRADDICLLVVRFGTTVPD
jgi:integral membrane sensor domain MASE1